MDDFRMLINIKNQLRTFIYLPIKLHNGIYIFFFKRSSKNLRLDFLKMTFSAFKLQNVTTHNRMEIIGKFKKKKLVFIFTIGYY